ncbi:hypothetical protein AA313_de0209467 [Arthrobotrys entomopaga]|nr:hypothetical protein AA313_de0209467 [Arthrobotrys entomopaga]
MFDDSDDDDAYRYQGPTLRDDGRNLNSWRTSITNFLNIRDTETGYVLSDFLKENAPARPESATPGEDEAVFKLRQEWWSTTRARVVYIIYTYVSSQNKESIEFQTKGGLDDITPIECINVFQRNFETGGIHFSKVPGFYEEGLGIRVVFGEIEST